MDNRIKALAEVALVFMALCLALRTLCYVPINFMAYGGDFASIVFFYVEATVIVLAVMAIGKRDFSRYGITLCNVRPDIRIIAISAIPVLVISLALVLTWIRWHTIGSALFVSGVEVLILFVLGKLWANVKGGEGEADGRTMAGILLLIPAISLPMIPDFARTALFLFIFVGPVEELIFRGYIQSRINEAFGRPYTFYGVSYGVGLVVSSLLFALWHALSLFSPFTGAYGLDIQWGLWIFFNGLVFGFLREKTGSLVAPSFLHALYDLPLSF